MGRIRSSRRRRRVAAGAATRPRHPSHAHRRRHRHRQGLHDPGGRRSAAHRDGGRARGRGAQRGNEYGASTGPPAALRVVRCGGRALLGARQRLRHPGPHQARRPRRARRGEGLHRLPLRGRAADRAARGHVGARGLRARLREPCRDGRRPPPALGASPSCPRRPVATSSGSRRPCGCEIGIVSTGPDRADTIVRSASAIASWYD